MAGCFVLLIGDSDRQLLRFLLTTLLICQVLAIAVKKEPDSLASELSIVASYR